MQIFVYKNGQQLGPLSEADVKSQLATGILSRQDMVWWEGQAGWTPLEQTPLAANLASTAPGMPPVHTPPVPGLVAPVGEKTSGLAIASLVCGLAMFLIGLTFIPAIICGHLGLSEIKRNPGMKGRGMALTGLILGYLFPILFIVSIVAISVLLALGQTVRGTFSEIQSEQMAPATTNSAPANGQ